MCGIAGFIGQILIHQTVLAKMDKCFNHRGPNDKGIWSDEKADIGFAHSRFLFLT